MGLLDIFAGFTASLLAAMGVGGGGLLVIYLTEFAKIEQRTAQGINLIFFLCASAVSLAVHLRKRRLALSHALFFTLGGTLGAVLGCLAAGRVGNTVLRKGFGILLIYAGIVTLYKTVSGYIKTVNANATEK